MVEKPVKSDSVVLKGQRQNSVRLQQLAPQRLRIPNKLRVERKRYTDVVEDSPATKEADEREKRYFLKIKEEHPDGDFVEDPRGRALEHDFEIPADSDEELPPYLPKASTMFYKIMRSNMRQFEHFGSKGVMRKQTPQIGNLH